MIPNHILEAQERWAPLTGDSPHWDNRLLIGNEDGMVHFMEPAHIVHDEWFLPAWNTAFKPDYSPMQMMQMGVFGDAYWGDALGHERAAMLPQNYPLTRLGTHHTNTRGKQCHDCNYHRRPASETRDWWLDKGLIYSWDPLGWFEWYCWYWLGRRIPHYDSWQVGRWVNFRHRQLAMYEKTRYPGSAQALLHWAVRAERNLI